MSAYATGNGHAIPMPRAKESPCPSPAPTCREGGQTSGGGDTVAISPSASGAAGTNVLPDESGLRVQAPEDGEIGKTIPRGQAAAADPPPGSIDAAGAGCTCPAIDNHHGRGYRDDPERFVVDPACALHGSTRDG